MSSVGNGSGIHVRIYPIVLGQAQSEQLPWVALRSSCLLALFVVRFSLFCDAAQGKITARPRNGHTTPDRRHYFVPSRVDLFAHK